MDFLTGDPAQLPAAISAFVKGQSIDPGFYGQTPQPEFTGDPGFSGSPQPEFTGDPGFYGRPQQPQPQMGATPPMMQGMPGAAPQRDPMMDSISRMMETVTNAYARVKSGQPTDRITEILKARSSEQPSWSDIGQAFSTSMGSISTTGDRKYVGVGEALNNIRANKILEAEKIAKVQIEDEKLKADERNNLAQEVSRLAQLGETARHNRATETGQIIKEILAPYEALARSGDIPIQTHAELMTDAMKAVRNAGAVAPTEVAEIVSATLANRGLPPTIKVMHVGNTLFSVTRSADGIPQVKEIGKAASTSGSPWQDKGPVMDRGSGEFLGYLLFNETDSEHYIRTKDGKLMPMGAMPNAVPSTRTALHHAMTPEQTLKLSDEVVTERQSIDALTRYMKFVNESPQGWDLFATEVIGKVRTALGDKISPKELVTLAQNGQLQGLIGRMRLQVVGGGVMTEQDAARIVAAVGGDVNALRNPDVVRTLIGQLVGMKAERYNKVLLPAYNHQSQMYPSIYPKEEPVTVDQSMFKVQQNDWPSGATAERDGPDGRKQYWFPDVKKWASPKITK